MDPAVIQAIQPEQKGTESMSQATYSCQEHSRHLGELTRSLLLSINGKEGLHGSGPRAIKTK